MNLKQLFVLLITVTSVSAYQMEWTPRYENRGYAEFWSCNQGVRKMKYDYVSPEIGSYTYYDLTCGYPPAVGSALLCANQVAKDDSDEYMKKVFKMAAAMCVEYSSYPEHTWEYFRDQFQNATEHHVEFDEIKNYTALMYDNFTPNKTLIEPMYIGYRSFYFNIDSGTYFAVGFCGFFLVLIIISAIHNFGRLTFSKSINNSKFAKLCQSYIIFPTVFPEGKFAEVYEWKFLSILVPNRIQFLVDLLMFVIQMAFYCISYRQNEGYFFGPARQNWQRFLADRTGIMAFGKIPLLILFAGRNNFLLWITGWSYSTCLHYHKMVAYWMSLDALIHSIGYTCDVHGYYTQDIKQTYFACGVAATVICFILIGATLYPIRRFFYEYFLAIHIILAIGYIVMCWYHCNILGWMEWMVAACAVWFFDRLVRVIRSAAFGWRTAKITVVGDELFKVEVEKPSWWFHKPGTFTYIYFAGWIFWENHPFTTVIENDKICAYIKVKKGVTLRVWNKLVANGGSIDWKVNVEGPYGGELSGGVRKYDDALLIAGGSGVPGILEHAASVSSGKLVWIAQHLAQVRAYSGLINQINVDVEIYVTREQGPEKSCSIQELLSDSDSSSEDDKKSVEGAGQVSIHYARPNMWDVVDSYVVNTPSSNVAIVACGPPRLMDELRHILSDRVTSWEKSIDFFDEFQIW